MCVAHRCSTQRHIEDGGRGVAVPFRDGRIVDELMAPTRDSVLDRMRNLGD